MTATMSRTIHVAHSPDADDAFMFWAMAERKIDTGGRRYVHELADIESLNRRALAGSSRRPDSSVNGSRITVTAPSERIRSTSVLSSPTSSKSIGNAYRRRGTPATG